MLSSCSAPAEAGADKPVGSAIQGDGGMTLTKVSSHAWVFTSFYDYAGSRTPANGLLIATSEGFVMVDTPWTDEQTDALMGLIDKSFGAKVVLAVFTHAHIDRIGGIKAHSPDNITVWLPGDNVLFGGCMIKAMDYKDLGSTTDADVGNWPAALGNVMKRYPEAAIVVPGYGAWGNTELLEHTAELCK